MSLDITPYATAGESVTYNGSFPERDAWCELEPRKQSQYLKKATRAIENLNFAGQKADDSQELQFPRGTDTSIPDDIKKACCELAWSFFDGVDADFEIENLRSVSQGVGAARVTYSPDVVLPHIVAGIPSIMAWKLLYPYLRDPTFLNINRG